MQTHAQTIQDVSYSEMSGQIADNQLNREVAELESLIESKIYREDELETRLGELERELSRQKAASTNGHADPLPIIRPSHSRQTSEATNGTTATEDRCELCEGPHDLDACPVFAGKMDGLDDRPSPLAGKMKRGKWCADCEVSLTLPYQRFIDMQSNEHDTVDCPMAEEVF